MEHGRSAWCDIVEKIWMPPGTVMPDRQQSAVPFWMASTLFPIRTDVLTGRVADRYIAVEQGGDVLLRCLLSGDVGH
ncbi:MAG: hypothetical protein H6594_10230 [Flavobacteriales bacterium]|nr:hypothetical protein [Flavobacteriales bacterium]